MAFTIGHLPSRMEGVKSPFHPVFHHSGALIQRSHPVCQHSEAVSYRSHPVFHHSGAVIQRSHAVCQRSDPVIYRSHPVFHPCGAAFYRSRPEPDILRTPIFQLKPRWDRNKVEAVNPKTACESSPVRRSLKFKTTRV